MTTPDTTQALLASEPVHPGCAERENALADR